MVDAYGNAITYEYYANSNRVSKITDAVGRTADFYYNYNYLGLLQLSQVTLNYGSQNGYAAGTVTWNFNFSQGYLSTVQYPAVPLNGALTNASVGFHYDINSNIDDVFDFSGNRWHYTYSQVDTLLALTKVNLPSLTIAGAYDSIVQNSFSYTKLPSTSTTPGTATCSITDANGNVWQHEYYDGFPATYSGAAYQAEFPSPIHRTIDPTFTGTLNPGNFTHWDTYEWNLDNGTIASYTDRNANKVEFTYHGSEAQSDPSGTSPTWTLYRRGLVKQKKRYLTSTSFEATTYEYLAPTYNLAYSRDLTTGSADYFEYDAAGVKLLRSVDDANTPSPNYPTLQTNSVGAHVVTTRTYFSNGLLASTKVGSDPITSFIYDSYGNPTQVTSPTGLVTIYKYDGLNNKRSCVVSSTGATTNAEYDGWNRLTKTTNPNGTSVTKTYDLNSNLLSITDEQGVKSTMTYDSRNRLISTTVPLNATESAVTSNTYDNNGNLLTLTNPNGWNTQYTYNQRNQLIETRHFPENTTRRVQFDGAGNTIRTQNGRGQTTTTTYDGFNRPTSVTHSSNSSLNVSFSYGSSSSNGQRSVTMTDAIGPTTDNFDGAGRLLSQIESVVVTGAGQGPKSITYSYDSSGRRKTMSIAGAKTFTYNYDPATTRLASITQTGGTVSTLVAYTYNANDTVDVRTTGDGTKTYYAYDIENRVTAMTYKKGPVGTETTLQTLGYTYDPWGTMKTYTNAIEGGPTFSTAYTHDLAGRLISEVRAGPASGAFSNQYSYDKNGNRTQVVRGSAVLNYTYKANLGDQLSFGEGYGFQYDADGNPYTWTAPSGENWDYHYDQNNQVQNAVGYFYVGGLPSLARSTAMFYDGKGRRVGRHISNSSGIVTKAVHYLYDGDNIVAEMDGNNVITSYRLPGVASIPVSGSETFFRDNAQGSNLATTNAFGVVQSQSEYDGYGKEYTLIAGPKTDFRFVGRAGYVTDDDLGGMDFLGSRFYNPTLGRFWNQDPIGQTGGINLYAYCGNSPLIRFDAKGHEDPAWYQFEFTWGGVGEGLKTALHASVSSISMGFYDGGTRKNSPGFAESRLLFDLAQLVMPSGGTKIIAGKVASKTAAAAKAVGVGAGTTRLANVNKAAELANEARIHSVYIRTNDYIGRTKDMIRRAKEWGVDLILVRGKLTLNEARQLEQALIDEVGIHNLANVINSIRKGSELYRNIPQWIRDFAEYYVKEHGSISEKKK